MADEIRIVVADDHPLVREGMRSMFAKQDGMSVVGEAGDGEEALGLVEQLVPDVLIIDASIPLVDGMEVARHLRGRRLRTRILVVSTQNLDEHVIALLEAGADGYLTKTASSSQLIDAVQRVHRGERVLDSAIEQRMAARIWARRRIEEAEPGKRLTKRQLHVLQLAARGWRNKAIAVELDIGIRTVQGHLSNVYGKLNVSSRMQAVLNALLAGPAEVGRNGQVGGQIRPPGRPGGVASGGIRCP